MTDDNVIPFPQGGRNATPGAGLSPEEFLADLLGSGTAPWGFGAAMGQRPQPKLLRKRSTKAAFVVRVDLDDAKPPIWRRLRLASDLTLDELHHILQTAMGWTDSHLHHFVMGPTTKDLRRQHFLAPYDIDEGEEGIAEEDVRLDQVIAEPGHRLFYEYDFGDSWQHTIKLEKVEPWHDDYPKAWCVTGKLACPPEDVGGLGGFAEAMDMLAGNTAGHDSEWVEQILTWLPEGYDPAEFSVDEVNELLTAAAPATLEDWNPGIVELLTRCYGQPQTILDALLARALLDDGGPSADQAEQAVGRYRLLLAKVGDGINLTKAGYLPPLMVRELYVAFSASDGWYGMGNREDKTLPVLELRESATTLGLLRKARGRLTVTAAGRKLADDPLALLRHIASRLPFGKDHERHAGLLALLVTAAGDDPYHRRPDMGAIMSGIGWALQQGGPIGDATYHWATATLAVIDSLGGRHSAPEDRAVIARELLRARG